MITRPTLIINENICRENIRRMAEKAKASGVFFRPHFKTHQSLLVAEWFRSEGVEGITVSSAGMAMKFALAAWKNITIAFPINIRETDLYNELAGKIDLHLLTDSIEATEALASGLMSSAGLFIEIDCGYGRSGIAHNNIDAIDAVISSIQKISPSFR
jgi:D-serine deaminase-like pyridoxal phosphate-dependent protein